MCSQLAEDIVLASMSRKTQDSNAQRPLPPKSKVISWVQTQEQLNLLGFSPESDGLWHSLESSSSKDQEVHTGVCQFQVQRVMEH